MDLYISITDTNDEAPVITDESRALVVPDGTEAGDVIGFITAVDRDASPPNNHVLYLLEDDSHGKFKIDIKTGECLCLVSCTERW